MPRSSRGPVSLAAIRDVARAVPAVQDRIVYEIPISEIRPSPRNPRRAFHNTEDLADSMTEHGLLQPVVVRRLEEGGYEQIAGHRRVLAAQLLGWQRIAAVVREAGDNEAYILTLVENLQREDLSAREEAAALEVLVRERGWTTRQVGEAIKRSPMYVSRRLRVFDDEALAPFVLDNRLPVSTAEELLRAAPEQRKDLAQQAVSERWERPQVRAALLVVTQRYSYAQPAPRLASHIRALSDELTNIDPSTVTARARREAVHLLEVLALLTRG